MDPQLRELYSKDYDGSVTTRGMAVMQALQDAADWLKPVHDLVSVLSCENKAADNFKSIRIKSSIKACEAANVENLGAKPYEMLALRQASEAATQKDWNGLVAGCNELIADTPALEAGAADLRKRVFVQTVTDICRTGTDAKEIEKAKNEGRSIDVAPTIEDHLKLFVSIAWPSDLCSGLSDTPVKDDALRLFTMSTGLGEGATEQSAKEVQSARDALISSRSNTF